MTGQGSEGSQESPRRVEVPVERVEVTITLDDLLTALASQARALAGAGGASPPSGPRGLAAAGAPPGRQTPPALAERLRRLDELAREMKREVDQIAELDSTTATRLRRGTSRG
jgi:hypothetical protein